MFFRRKKKEEAVNNTPENIEVEFKCEYNQNDECNLLHQLKEKQKKFVETSDKINRLRSFKFEFTALHSLLEIMEEYNVTIGKEYSYQLVATPKSKFRNHLENYGDRYIQKAVNNLPSLETIDEIKRELERCYEFNAEIERLQRSCLALAGEITELKKKLGIR